MNESLKHLLHKLTSGKLFLTFCAGVVFIYATVARILPEEAIASIVSTVFAMYFLKKENGTKEEK